MPSSHLGLVTSVVPPGLPPLTSRESQVARLAAARWTDREIAEALVVSVRTVESHLASAYRKLGVGSRRHLASLLVEDRRELPAPPPPAVARLRPAPPRRPGWRDQVFLRTGRGDTAPPAGPPPGCGELGEGRGTATVG